MSPAGWALVCIFSVTPGEANFFPLLTTAGRFVTVTGGVRAATARSATRDRLSKAERVEDRNVGAKQITWFYRARRTARRSRDR